MNRGSIIAFGGKGGSGKTTLAAMTLRGLIRAGVSPVLAVDADSNATLGMTLGVDIPGTIADLRDQMGDAAKKVTEIPKDRLMDQYLAELLAEEKGFDLLTMGRPEGPSCYCYVNGLLRRYLSLLRKNYACVLVDCEAGMEYLSRLVVDDVEALVLVAEGTPVGLTTAGRISELADALPITVKRRVLAVNKVGLLGPDAPAPETDHIENIDATLHVPFDTDLARRCAGGEPVDESAGDAARATVEQLVDLCRGATAGQTTA